MFRIYNRTTCNVIISQVTHEHSQDVTIAINVENARNNKSGDY